MKLDRGWSKDEVCTIDMGITCSPVVGSRDKKKTFFSSAQLRLWKRVYDTKIHRETKLEDIYSERTTFSQLLVIWINQPPMMMPGDSLVSRLSPTLAGRAWEQLRLVRRHDLERLTCECSCAAHMLNVAPSPITCGKEVADGTCVCS